jgi:hypothetical protein
MMAVRGIFGAYGWFRSRFIYKELPFCVQTLKQKSVDLFEAMSCDSLTVSNFSWSLCGKAELRSAVAESAVNSNSTIQ